MRVIAGTARGRKLKSPPASTRPITDRVKENLFNILGTDVIDARVLDLYAGAGSVGIEALSRGATHATFVELDEGAVKTIRENLLSTRLADRARVVKENVYKFLKRPPPGAVYDLIYIAPPQYREMWTETLQLLDARPELLDDDGTVVVQIHPVEYAEQELETLEMDDERRYGSTLLCFYSKRPPTDDELPPAP
jgi:16S rRNA (guanine(966)-N(2))-methyltransferase RsmD